MADAKMAIELPGVDFAAMARQAVAAKLTEAIVGSDALIQSIVAEALSGKVNAENGKKSDYHHQNTVAYVEWVAIDLIRKMTLKILNERTEELRPVISKALEAELKRSAKVHAKVLADSFVERAKSAYGISVDVVLKTVPR